MSQTKTQLVEGLNINTSAPADALAIDNSGRVGLGTSSPSTSLHVYSAASTADSTRYNLLLQDSTSYAEGVGGGINFGFKYDSTGNLINRAAGIAGIKENGTDGNYAGALTFHTTQNSASTGERMRIDSSGRVGIGTTSPARGPLHVHANSGESHLHLTNADTGSTSEDGFSLVSLTNTDNRETWLIQRENAAMRFYINSSQRMALDTSGRLLVGTTSGFDHSTITIQGNSSSTSADGIIAFRRGAGNPTANQALGTLSFNDGTNQTGGFIQMIAAGNWASGSSYPTSLTMGLTKNGTTSQTERLRMVDGGSIFTRASDTGAQIGSEAGAGTSVSLLQMGYGAYGIFNCTISFKVWTNGDVVNTNNSYGSLSDIKLKENIVDASSQWDDIKAIQIRKYNFKEETGYATHTQLGVVAQEVELVSPGLVYESPDKETVQIPVLDENGDAVFDENGDPTFTTEERETGEVTKSVNYSVLYMKAVKALQEAMERIETLETAHASQGATIAALDARLTALEGA